MATVQTLYPAAYDASTTHVNTPAGTIETSSGFTGGGETDAASNISFLDLDHLVTGMLQTAAGTAANTQAQLWVVPCQTDDLASSVTWPDVFDGNASVETVTSYGVLQGCGRLAQVVNIDLAGAHNYNIEFFVAPLFGGILPTRYVIFMTQNTGGKVQMTDPSGLLSAFPIERFQATVA